MRNTPVSPLVPAPNRRLSGFISRSLDDRIFDAILRTKTEKSFIANFDSPKLARGQLLASARRPPGVFFKPKCAAFKIHGGEGEEQGGCSPAGLTSFCDQGAGAFIIRLEFSNSLIT